MLHELCETVSLNSVDLNIWGTNRRHDVFVCYQKQIRADDSPSGESLNDDSSAIV